MPRYCPDCEILRVTNNDLREVLEQIANTAVSLDEVRTLAKTVLKQTAIKEPKDSLTPKQRRQRKFFIHYMRERLNRGDW